MENTKTTKMDIESKNNERPLYKAGNNLLNIALFMMLIFSLSVIFSLFIDDLGSNLEVLQIFIVFFGLIISFSIIMIIVNFIKAGNHLKAAAFLPKK